MVKEGAGEEPALSAAIVTAVQEHWKKTNRALLMSVLGWRLKEDQVWDGSKASFTLAHYVDAFLTDRVRVLTRPGVESVIGLFPADEDLGTDLAALFSAPPKPTPIAFHKFVWEAFQTEFLREWRVS